MKIIFYTAKNGKNYFKSWLESIRSKENLNKIEIRLKRVELGNFGDYKNLGGGLSELRFKNGLRLYYTRAENIFVVLFYGGSKAKQAKDIAFARELLEEFIND